MIPVLFTADRLVVRSYAVVMGLSFAMVLAWLAWQDRRLRDGRLDAALWTAALGLLGARLVHVMANADYYWERPAEALSLRQGGLSLHGGLLAGLVALSVYAWLKAERDASRWPARFFALVAALMPALALGLVGGWLACLTGGCAYGRAVPPPQRFYTPDWPDLYGVHAFRLPSQLLGLLLSLGLLAAAFRLGRWPGLLLVLYALGDFLIGFTRGDLQVAWGSLWTTQWADLALIVIGLAMMLVARRYGRQPGRLPVG